MVSRGHSVSRFFFSFSRARVGLGIVGWGLKGWWGEGLGPFFFFFFFFFFGGGGGFKGL